MSSETKKPSKIGGYTPTQELGSGAMGQLWLCHDKSLDRMVVVKQMQQDIEDSDVNIRRFMQEGNILAHLNHPAITKPYALWKEKDGKLSLSMEFVHGLTLRQILDKVKQPPLWIVLNILHEILCALGEAHRKGIVHRDIKPANIMIDNDGRIHLLDFGIAHSENLLQFNKGEDAERLTQTGAILGTVTYMSPEQTVGEEATPASDLFAVGIVASEMLLGQNIFRGSNFSDTLQRIQKLRVTEKAFDKDLPRRLKKLIVKMLNKDPRKRPLTAFDAAEQVSLIMRNYPRDMVPYTAMWIFAIKDSIKQKTESIDETLYTEPPIYPTHVKFHFFKGLAAGVLIGFLISFIVTRFI
ncbi:serine/threonine-protein kinase [Fibrobacter sp. UWB10]|uniref:serine/threonine protein kinase n=1 Tax=Fibrobacter sp. UWB10 TaxID=1896201 RepID=UPI00240365F9|nr:serine/threonine-protein kinase [Fibrobacter sp. UWB10]SMP48046.1 serine/threonine protein kinase [Fibrobacter sp. UWB10]